MITTFQKSHTNFVYKALSSFICLTFICSVILPPRFSSAALTPKSFLDLPEAGSRVPVSQPFVPTTLKGLVIYPDNPLQFDFIVDTGNSNLKGAALKNESRKLIKYFLAALTVPENELWVNLSPYESERVISESFGQTAMGRDLLAQDYLLKQMSASLMYPEDELGKKFWDRVYKKAYDLYGTTDIPLNTFNKVWIVPQKASVYENGNTVSIIDGHLKVMLEEDYLALEKNKNSVEYGTEKLIGDDVEVVSGVTSDIIKEVLIPEIEREVNEGQTFENLRQIFNSLILAAWYKEKMKGSLLGQIYFDQNKTRGVDITDKAAKDKIYSQYVEALHKGVYDYIKEEYDPVEKETIPRKYFSGGFVGNFKLSDKGIERFLKLSPEQRRKARAIGDQYRMFVRLAELSPEKQNALHQNTYDVLLGLAHDGKADFINALDWREAGEDGQTAVQGVKDAFVQLSRKGSSGAGLLAKFITQLADGQLPDHQLINAKGEMVPEKPGIYFLKISDWDLVNAILHGQKLIDGHASDRGIHVSAWKALRHEVLAMVGLSHPEVVAYEIFLDATAQGQSIDEVLANSSHNQTFRHQLKAGRFDSQWILDFQQTIALAEEQLVKNLAQGRDPDLLTKITTSGQRDFAMLSEKLVNSTLAHILADLPGRFSKKHIEKGKEEQIDEERQTIGEVLDDLDRRYMEVSIERVQRPKGLTGNEKQDAEKIAEKQKEDETTRMRIVRQAYDIGKAAYNKEEAEGEVDPRQTKQPYSDDPMISMIAFNKVMEMQVLMKHSYGETTRGSEYTLADNMMPKLMSRERAQEMGLSQEYIDSFDQIKDARQLYVDAYQSYLSKKDNIGEVAVENIIYDLGISADQLFWGINEQSGRSITELIHMALSLREMIFTEDQRITISMRAQAASYLEFLFNKYLHNGKASKSIDQGGGLTVPKDIYDAMHSQEKDEAKKFDQLKDAETKAFAIFLANVHVGTLQGRSLTAMKWLSEIYHNFGAKFYAKSVSGAVKLERKKQHKDKMLGLEMLEEQDSLEKMWEIYEDKQNSKFFAQASPEFLNGSKVGVHTDVPVRLELSAGGIQDSSFLSTYRPRGYNVLNLAAQLAREDGTLGRSIGVTFEIRKQDQMPKNKDGETSLVTVKSLDMGFEIHATSAQDLLKKNKAAYVIEPLISLGFFPKPILDKAKEDSEKKNDRTIGQKALRRNLDHVIGKGNCLVATLHVRDITSGSGLAISSLLAMGVATSFDVLVGEKNSEDTEERPKEKEVTLNQLNVQVEKDGLYQVELTGMDQNNKGYYVMLAQAYDGEFALDLSEAELSGPGLYHIRLRRVSDDEDQRKFELGKKDKSELSWDKFLGVVDVKKTVDEDEVEQKNGFSVSRRKVVYQYMDDEDTIKRAITTSQYTVLRLAGKAGTQDEVSGGGGVMLLLGGKPLTEDGQVKYSGSVVPQMHRIQLIDEAKKNLEKGIRILRVGFSESSEPPLEEVFANTMLNVTRSQLYAWGQITIEMARALALGDIVEVGRLANAAIPLRERMAPISIDPIILRALEKMKRKYGHDLEDGGAGFSYGITGARTAGSVLLFFDSRLSEKRKDKITEEILQAVDQSIKAVGKLAPREEKPYVFKRWMISRRGTRVQALGREEMDQMQERYLDPHETREDNERIYNQDENALYKPEEVELALAENPPEKSPAMKGEPIKTIDENLAAEVLTVVNSPDDITPEVVAGIRNKAADVFKKKYRKFKAPGAAEELRRILRQRIDANMDLVIQAKLSAEDQHLLFMAVLRNEVDLLWDWGNIDNVRGFVDSIKNLQKVTSPQTDAQRETFLNQLTDAEKAHVALVANGKAMDGKSFVGPRFYGLLKSEIAQVKRRISELEQKMEDNPKLTQADRDALEQDSIELQNLELMLEMLQLAPNPEVLPYGHFLFKLSKTYRSMFEEMMDGLDDAVKEGALVHIISSGGKGSRFFKGSKVKHVAPFHSGNESNASFLKLLIRRWAAFLAKFPDKREGFIHIAVSSFTKSAILAVLDDMADEAGISKDKIATPSQGLSWPTWPTEMELALQLALQTTSTKEEREELKREFDKYREQARKALQNANEGRDPDDLLTRALYDEQPDLNPINKYNPSGNAGSLETILSVPSPVYTGASLIAAGYKINDDMRELMLKTSEGRRQYIEGMPLAKAALLVEGKGLSVGIIQQASSRAHVGGGDLAVADAIKEILRNKVMAVAQYANMAGGTDMAGVLAVDKDGFVTTLEGQRSTFLEDYLIEQDHTAVATGTVFLNLKVLYKVLGYDNPEQFVRASNEKVRKRMVNVMKKEWPSLYTIRERQQEKVGDREEWPVLQQEANLQWVLTWMQKKFQGISPVVKYQEVTPTVAFVDDKELKELNAGLERAQHFQASSMKTQLPPGRIEDASVAVEDYLTWTKFYLSRGLLPHASEVIAQAKRSVMLAGDDLTPTEKYEYSLKIRSLLNEVEERYKKALANPRKFVKPRSYDKRLVSLYEEQHAFDFKLHERTDEDLRQRVVELRELIFEIEHLLLEKTKRMRKSLEKELGAEVPLSIFIPMISRLLINDDLDETLERYGFSRNIINTRGKMRLREEVKLLRNEVQSLRGGVDDAMNPVRLAYFRQEFTALFDRVAEEYLMRSKDSKLNGMRTSEHRVIYLVDKDATIEDPGTVLKQVASLDGLDQLPHRALELVRAAIRGAEIHILTGSTTQEAWTHVLEPVSRVLYDLKIPKIMKKMAILRMKVLANDGTMIMELEMGDDDKISAKPIEPNKKFMIGKEASKNKWEEAGTLRLWDENNKEIKRNRLIVRNASIRAYLGELFSDDVILRILGVEKGSREEGQINHFINQLSSREEDLFDLNSDDAEFVYQSEVNPLDEVLKKMLEHWDDQEHKPEDNLWKTKFQEILAAESTALKKLENIKDDPDLEGIENIYAAIRLINLKESSGTYASLSGDPMDERNKEGDNIKKIKDIVLRRNFWVRTKNRIDKMFDSEILAKRFLDKDGEGILFETRNGPGYLNMSFGGVSKKNYIDGVLLDERTRGYTVVLAGDSITDQGNFPFISQALISRKMDALGIEKFGIPDGLKRKGLSWDTDRNAFIYQGIMDEDEYDELSRLAGKLVDKKKKAYQNIINTLYASSQTVHQSKIPIRILLGTLFEVDDQEVEKMMEGGLVRTEHRASTPNPFGDGHSLERWGPVGFYPVVSSVLDAAGRGFIIPKSGLTALEKRDRVLRGVIESLNRKNVKDFGIIVPETMRVVKSFKPAKRKKVKGVVLKPTIELDWRESLSPQVIEKIRKGRKRQNEQVRAIVKKAQPYGGLIIEGYLRAFDGPPSTQDVKEFREMLTLEGVDNFDDLPAIMTLSSSFKIKITIEPADNLDEIVYVNLDKKNEKKHVSTGPVQLTDKGKYEGVIPNGQIDAPAYIFQNIFGISGVKVTMEGISPMALAGGVDSANNAFVLGLIEAANLLTGAGLSQGDIMNLAMKLENHEFLGLTGNSGNYNALFGGVFEHIFTSGIKDENGKFVSPMSSISVPILSGEDLKDLEQHMMVVQAGKEYKKGVPQITRLSAFVNGMFRGLLVNRDPVAIPLFLEALDLKGRFMEAARRKDFKTEAETTIRFVEIRDKLVHRWLELMLDARPGLNKNVPEYAKDFWMKTFTPDIPGYKLVKETFIKGGKVALGLELIKKAKYSTGEEKERAIEILNKEVGPELADALLADYDKFLEFQKPSFSPKDDQDQQGYLRIKKEFEDAVVSADSTKGLGSTYYMMIQTYESDFGKPYEGVSVNAERGNEDLNRYSEIFYAAAREKTLNTRFYTYGPVAPLFEAAKKEGIAIMPQGAGGPGANLMAIDPQGIEHLKEFLEKQGLTGILDADARKFISGEEDGTLVGYMELEIGDEPLRFINWDKVFDKDPKVGIRPDEMPEILVWQDVTDEEVGLPSHENEYSKEDLELVRSDGEKRKGGIDLNPALFSLEIKRDQNGVPLPLKQQPLSRMRIDGFIPMIINVTPIMDSDELLGHDTQEDETESLSHAELTPFKEEVSWR